MLLWSKGSHARKLAGHIVCRLVIWWAGWVPIFCWPKTWFGDTWCCSVAGFLQSVFGKWILSRKWFLEISLEDRFWVSHYTTLEWVLNFWREDLENMMTLVFSGLSFILHLAHHFANFCRSLRKSFAVNCTFLPEVHRAVSSANWDFEFCMWSGFGKSMTYIRKSNGLRAELCRTPAMGLILSERKQFTLTWKTRPTRKSESQRVILVGTSSMKI